MIRENLSHFFRILLLGLLLLPGFASAQNQPVKRDSLAKPQLKSNTSIAEDVQRFLGFESPLPFRYLSLPFDTVMTVNVKFFTIDLGFLLLILLPLALFLSPKTTRGWILGVVLLLLILFLIISMATAYLGPGLSPKEGMAQLSEEMHKSAGFWARMRQYGQFHFLQLFAPMFAGIAGISGEQDYITYPLLAGILVLVLLILHHRYRHAGLEQKALLLFALLYGCFWLMLSPGLPWYGYLILILGPLLVVYAWTQNRPEGLFKFSVQKAFLYGLVGIWMLSAFSLRMSNYSARTVEEAKQVFYLPPAMYRMGAMNETKVLENFRTGYPRAINLLNREDKSMVYQVGTSLPYFITKNDARCFADGFLEFFVQLSRRYEDKVTLIKVLKASGFRYIVIDLNLPQADETPEQNLRKKFDAFMNVLYRNPQVELLVTDRKVKFNANGEVKYEVFLNNAKVVAAGSFALYQIK